ncbi:hypothetical protein BY458DRAFT_476619 [Sporodiniella umbellata]|nr:hypothetical protein BY458DRAFT_476619 [Sporodiniella umbellata]
MLHIQESFVHNTSLLMSPPISVIVQPQASTSSRTNKVAEQLAARLDAVHKELANVRLQIEHARQTKLQHEKDTHYYNSANNIIRSRIQEIMQTLECKQTTLNETKKASSELEKKVKQLKDEALASRHQLEGLRKREQVLEHDRDVAVKERNGLQHQRYLLQDSVDKLKDRNEKELNLLKRDHETVREHSQCIKERNELLMDLVYTKLKQRRQHTEAIINFRQQSKANSQAFMTHVYSLLSELKLEIEQSATKTKSCLSASAQCSGEVHGLLNRIRTIAAEITASES